MKGAIATVEIYVFEGTQAPQRLTLTIAAPERAVSGIGWQCRVALANLHPPETFDAPDSVQALAAAVDRGRSWVAELRAQGRRLCRDRAGLLAFDWGDDQYPIG